MPIEFTPQQSFVVGIDSESCAFDAMAMIGDAPGDRDAAHAVGAPYYPINPGGEEIS